MRVLWLINELPAAVDAIINASNTIETARDHVLDKSIRDVQYDEIRNYTCRWFSYQMWKMPRDGDLEMRCKFVTHVLRNQF